MQQAGIVVLDIGKTLAKLSLWSAEWRLVDRRTRPNARCDAPGYPALDVVGIERWLTETLRDFAKQERIGAIVPVAHGAAAVVVNADGTYVPPLDYEGEPPQALRDKYLAERDAFMMTGSPALPAGLNLGLQLAWLETLDPRAKLGTIVTWPQFWAWRLSGIAATEVTSLGCHTDLWQPAAGRPSPLARGHGWAERLAPLRRAGEALGSITEAWRKSCGLPKGCQVYCGLHDSNADLLAVRGYAQIGQSEHTVLSTGTWFIAMRTAAEVIDLASIPQGCDCLVNVDAFNALIPSARFMGGRELEALEDSPEMIDAAAAARALYAATAEIAEGPSMALPTFCPGVGPYPQAKGRWIEKPNYQLARRAAADLYLALMTDAALDLIGSKDRLVIEGRFAADPIFSRALASLRPQQTIYCTPATSSIAIGAMRLLRPGLKPEGALTEAEPLPFSIAGYAKRWHQAMRTDAERFARKG